MNWLIILGAIVVLVIIVFIIFKLTNKEEDDLDLGVSRIRGGFDKICGKIKRMVGC